MFTAQLRIRKDSFAEGKTLSQAVERAGGEMRVLRIQRGSGTYVVNFPDAVLRADDRLLLTDTPKNLKQFETALGGTLYSGDVEVDEEHPLTAEDQQISEIVVVEGSTIEGSTLKQLQFIDRYQLVVLALHRAGKELVSLSSGKGMGDVRLRAGDVLLVQGSAEQIANLRRDDQFLVLDATADLPHSKKSPTAILIMAVVILVAAFGVLPIAISAVVGVLADDRHALPELARGGRGTEHAGHPDRGSQPRAGAGAAAHRRCGVSGAGLRRGQLRRAAFDRAGRAGAG